MPERRTKIALLAALTAVGALVSSRVVRARRVWRLAGGLDTPSTEERIQVARALVDLGLRASAADLLLLARTDHDTEVLAAVARAVLDAPDVTRPSANVRALLQWAETETDTATAPEATPLRLAKGDER